MGNDTEYDIIIVGGGAAALAASIYAVRAMLKTLIIEKQAVGGQILYTGEIENYPGFPEPIGGPDLAQLYEKQALRFGVEFEYDTVESLDVEGEVKRVICSGWRVPGQGDHHRHRGRAQQAGSSGGGRVLGAWRVLLRDVRRQLLPRHGRNRRRWRRCGDGRGAVPHAHDGQRDRRAPAATNCGRARFCNSALSDHPKMNFIWDTVVEEITGNGDVNGMVLKNLKTGEVWQHPTQGVFVFIGFHPVNDFMRGVVELDNAGHVVTNLQMGTNIPGVFAAGDVRQFLRPAARQRRRRRGRCRAGGVPLPQRLAISAWAGAPQPMGF